MLPMSSRPSVRPTERVQRCHTSRARSVDDDVVERVKRPHPVAVRTLERRLESEATIEHSRPIQNLGEVLLEIVFGGRGQEAQTP